MKTRYLFGWLLALVLLAVRAEAQDTNKLYIPDVTGLRGETISLPVNMDNTSEITAVQFTLEVPSGVTLDMQTVSLSERKNDHVVTAHPMGGNKYMFMLYSPTNALIQGQQGEVLTMELPIPDNFTEGESYDLKLTEVALSRTDGTNALTAFEAGTLLVKKSPDLSISELKVDKQTLNPSEKVSVSWQVTNVGGLDTGSGWSEQISLVGADGETTSLIGTLNHNGTLAVDAVVSRQAEVELPALIGLDGSVKLQVKLIPGSGCGERSDAMENNAGQVDVTLGKVLYLELPQVAVDENSQSPVRCKLSRSGSWESGETFTLAKSADGRLDVPASVTIPEGQSGVFFYINLVDNDTLDSDTAVAITVSGNGYEAVSGKFLIEDNEFPALTAEASKVEINEGETFQLTIQSERAPSESVTLYLTSDHPKRFTHPSQVTLPAGEKEVTVDVEAVNDNLPDVTVSAAFTVSAAKHNAGEALVILYDDDVPEIELTLTQNTISEYAGLTAVVATLRRVTHSDNPITVKISDDANGRLYYSTNSITLDAGVTEAQFTIGVVDNDQVDGEQTFTVTAAVYISSCSCAASGTSAGVVSKTLTVLDNDGPTLVMTASKSMLIEGDSIGAELMILRNTSVGQPLTVTLTSDGDEWLEYEHTVTIPADRQWIKVPVVAKADNSSSEDRTVVFTATSEGYTQGSCWMMITDRTLPDATVVAEPLQTEIEAGDTLEVGVTIGNEGVVDLPTRIPVTIYMNGHSMALAKLYTQEAVEPGCITSLYKKIILPDVTGERTLRVVVNEAQSVKELTYLNNTVDNLAITLLPKFTATVQTDKAIYKQGEPIVICGEASGSEAANTEVEVYIINDGVRQTETATTDADGQFSITWQPYANQSGHFIIGACYPSEGLETEQAAFDVYGLKKIDYVRCETLAGIEYTGTVALSNPGLLPLTDVKVEVVTAPADCEVTFEPIDKIEGGETVKLNFKVTGKQATEGSDWELINARVKTAEGVSESLTMFYYCRSPKGQLKADIPSINTTMVKGSSRDYPFTITNVGKGETGKITLVVPETGWMKLVTPQEMASLAHGESATVILRLTPTDDMQLNVPVTGRIGINCENGSGIPMDFYVEPVSETTGTLTIEACDEYTYYTTEGPRLQGAKVLVKHPTTGELVAQGLTGEDGKFSVELPEGYYALSVTADKHDSYQNNVLVNPGRETVESAFLSFQAITFSWDVVETEVEDEYKIVTTVKYETNVPAPVVEIIYPEEIPCKNHIFNIVAINRGLLPAYDVEPVLPTDNEYMSFEFLGANRADTLLPQASTVFAVKVTAKHPMVHGGGTTIIYGGPYGPNGPDEPDGPNGGGSDNDDDSGDGGDTGDGGGSGDDGGSDDGGSDDGGGSGSTICIRFDRCITVAWTVRICDQSTGNWKIVKKSTTRCYSYYVGDCPRKYTPAGSNSGGGGWWSSGPGGGYGVSGYGGYSGSGAISTTIKNCNPCVPNMLKRLFECGKEWFPLLNCGEKTINAGSNPNYDTSLDAFRCWMETVDGAACLFTGVECLLANQGGMSRAEQEKCLMDGLKNCGGAVFPPIEWAFNIKKCWDIFAAPCDETEMQSRGARSVTRSSAVAPSYITAFYDNTIAAIDELSAYRVMFDEYFGEPVWASCDMLELCAFKDTLDKVVATDPIEKASEVTMFCPANISWEQLIAYVEREMKTDSLLNGLEVEGTNYVNFQRIDSCINVMIKAESKAVELGYSSSYELLKGELNILEKNLTDASSQVCASITLQLSQTMTMTRQAFRGTLTLFNGNETTDMTGVKLSLEVRDEEGTLATAHEFQINAESLDKFGGELSLDAGWSLAAGETGVATILFIPTKYAAPTVPKKYSFGGTLSYVDPFTGLEVTRDLYPVTLTVKPSPNLDLTYFMQRDVFGDDALTTNVVEPMVPAEFSLLINNTGYGDATNVRMVTDQPEIVDNEKGLLIDFELLSSQLEGGEHTLALGGSVATDFGTIPAHSTTYAQWWLQSTLLGHFTEYNVEATHVTSYGNEDLSLLNEVTIHELIRSLKIPANDTTWLAGFLVNDITDAEDMPDMLYLSDATIESVAVTKAASMTMNSDTEYVLEVTPAAAGWNYGSIIDPTAGRQGLVSIVRVSDGEEINLRNFWQTDRTLRDGRDPLYENRLHFADKMGTTAEQYLLTFEPRPAVELQVESFSGVPKDTEVLHKPLESLTVRFNKAVVDTTFTTDDLALNCQGQALDASQIVITAIDEKEFKLDVSALTALANGYYVLTVQTAHIQDKEGFAGRAGKTTSWIQYVDGKVSLKVLASPEEGGQVSPASGLYMYGDTLTLSAIPAEGYEFLSWKYGDEVLSTTPTCDYVPNADATVVASFVPKHYNVTLEYDAVGGMVTGSATGIYQHGDVLEFVASPMNWYNFDGWKINGELVGYEKELTVTVKEPMLVEALFSEIVNVTLDYTLSAGWNWFSVNVADKALNDVPALLAPVGSASVILIGQAEELVNDPVYGWLGTLDELSPRQAYKLQVAEPVNLSLTGLPLGLDGNTITLENGWNWVGYLPQVEMSVNDALRNVVATTNDVVKGQDAFAMYDGTSWAGSLETMKPGAGYLFYSQGVKSFNYPSRPALTFNARPLEVQARGINNIPDFWEYDEHRYADNMSIVAQLRANGVNGDFLIAAFVDDECRGMAVEEKGYQFITVHGNVAGQPVRFKALDKLSGQIYDLNETTLFQNGALGNFKTPLYLSLGATNIGSIENGLYLTTTDNLIRFFGDVEKIRQVCVTDVNGIVQKHTEGIPAGNTVDISELAVGVYVVTVNTDSGIMQKKVIKK